MAYGKRRRVATKRRAHRRGKRSSRKFNTYVISRGGIRL